MAFQEFLTKGQEFLKFYDMHPEPVNMGLGGLWRGQNAPDSGNKIQGQVQAYFGLGGPERIVLCSDYDLITAAGERYYTVTLDTKTIAKKPEYVLRGAVNGCTVFPGWFFSEVGYFGVHSGL